MRRVQPSALLLSCLALASAAQAALPIRGSCGLYAEVPNNYGTHIYGSSIMNHPPGESQPANMTAVVNFRTRTIDFSINLATNNNGAFEFSELADPAAIWAEATSGRPWSTVAIGSGPLSGVSLNFLPVNNGLSYHVRGAPGSNMERLHGICTMQ